MGHLAAYLGNLSLGRAILWCYLIWYLTMAGYHFVPAPRIWLTSLGIGALVGVALTLSSAAPGQPVRPGWQLYRLFLIPFCVSSFSALVKDCGFVLICSPVPAENGVALALCAGFLGAVAVIRRFSGREPVTASSDTRRVT